jgi:hypothetical protein
MLMRQYEKIWNVKKRGMKGTRVLRKQCGKMNIDKTGHERDANSYRITRGKLWRE